MDGIAVMNLFYPGVILTGAVNLEEVEGNIVMRGISGDGFLKKCKIS